MYIPLSVGVLFLVFVSLPVCVTSNHLDEEEGAGCFTLIVYPMSCNCKCSTALPRGAVGWSALCDNGILVENLVPVICIKPLVT